MTTAASDTVLVANALGRYFDHIQHALREVAAARGGLTSETFNPGFELPSPDVKMLEFLAQSDLSFHDLPDVDGTTVKLLDLGRNPRTRTTKTFASRVIVARAVHFIRSTNERVMIVTPTSANKGTALRDAVLRAIETGLVTAQQLRIATVAPGSSLPKLWRSPLSTDTRLAAMNPVVVCPKADGATVKTLAKESAEELGTEIVRDTGIHVWYTLEIDNYRTADVVRAFAEEEFCPAAGHRTHVHAVSSAYGLLGHHFGRKLLEQQGTTTPAPSYFLVQQPATPDMVLSLAFGSTDREHVPGYRFDRSARVYRQSSDRRFPPIVSELEESIDATFYTHNPPTAPAMSELIGAQGGGGIVVSLRECLEAYGSVRAMLADTQIDLPADPRKLREWATVMAVTGALKSLERGLLQTDEVVIHASGSYSSDTMRQIESTMLQTAETARDVATAIRRASTAG